MDKAMAKLIITCFVCEIIGLTAGVPLKDTNYENASTKIKRSPDNFSLFGRKSPFSVSIPIVSPHQAINHLSGLFTHGGASHHNYYNENSNKPTEIQSAVNNTNSIREILPNSSPAQNANDIKNTETLHSNMPVNTTTNIIVQNSGSDKYVKKNDNQKASIDNGKKNLHTFDHTDKSDDWSKDNSTNKDNEEIVEIDKAIIESIFKDLKKENEGESTSTTEDPMDYTTGTGDYDQTTIDDLLRIPAPVVATLLG